MRTLKRPMFNMGGPIKEGVMHGIREPRKEGGRTGFQFGSKGWHVPTATGVAAGAAGAAIPSGTTAAGTGRIAATIDKFKKTQSLLQNPKFSEKYLWELGKKYVPKAARGILGAAKWGLGRFPAVATAVGGEYVTRPKDWEKEMGISRWDKLKRDLTPWYGTQEKIQQYQDWKKQQADKLTDQITITETEKGPPGGGDQRMTYTDPDTATKLAKADKERRLNNILEIMGYDKSKKTAVHRALVDASQILHQTPGGDQLDITKDIISPIIAATGKRLEKPADIREAAGLMMAKGEIEKEIASGKPGNQLKAAQDYAELNDISLSQAYKDLGFTKVGKIAEVMAGLTSKGQPITADNLEIALKSEIEGVVPKLKLKNKEWTDWSKKNPKKTELEYVQEIKEKEPGYYIIDKRIVVVDNNGKVRYKW
jgi:hypothetical protein